MKNKVKILLSVLVAGVALAASLPSLVVAKGPADVSHGLHNLSSAYGTSPDGGDSPYRSDEAEVCVFCHTPHGGGLSAPLWNRNNPSATSFKHYSSTYLGTYLAGAGMSTRAVNNESLVCMSCHDGSISYSHVINLPNTRNGALIVSGGGTNETIGLGFVVGARIGASQANMMGTGDLSDDHPISFSYDSVLAADPYNVAGARYGELRPVATARTWAGEGVKFFPPGNRVECTTCHDPHVFYDWSSEANAAYSPFMIMPNTGSDLCFACHNK